MPQGIPKTEEERMMTHYQQYGTTVLPPRGTKVARASSQKLTANNGLVFIVGMVAGGFLTYFFLRPAATVGKAKQIYGAFK
jgi:hypothetical protein